MPPGGEANTSGAPPAAPRRLAPLAAGGGRHRVPPAGEEQWRAEGAGRRLPPLLRTRPLLPARPARRTHVPAASGGARRRGGRVPSPGRHRGSSSAARRASLGRGERGAALRPWLSDSHGCRLPAGKRVRAAPRRRPGGPVHRQRLRLPPALPGLGQRLGGAGLEPLRALRRRQWQRGRRRALRPRGRRPLRGHRHRHHGPLFRGLRRGALRQLLGHVCHRQVSAALPRPAAHGRCRRGGTPPPGVGMRDGVPAGMLRPSAGQRVKGCTGVSDGRKKGRGKEAFDKEPERVMGGIATCGGTVRGGRSVRNRCASEDVLRTLRAAHLCERLWQTGPESRPCPLRSDDLKELFPLPVSVYGHGLVHGYRLVHGQRYASTCLSTQLSQMHEQNVNGTASLWPYLEILCLMSRSICVYWNTFIYVYRHTCAYTCINKYAVIAAAFCNPGVPAVLRHFATFSPAREKAPSGAVTDQITRDKSIARKWAENEWAGDERGSLAGLELGRWRPWGNTATSREPRAGRGTAGCDRTGPTELISLRGCSSFPNQASIEPWRAQRALLRGEIEVAPGCVPLLSRQPQHFHFPLPVWIVRSPFELRAPRGVGAAGAGAASWLPWQASGRERLCGAWGQRKQCQPRKAGGEGRGHRGVLQQDGRCSTC